VLHLAFGVCEAKVDELNVFVLHEFENLVGHLRCPPSVLLFWCDWFESCRRYSAASPVSPVRMRTAS
jgi:hypothetical protein